MARWVDDEFKREEARVRREQDAAKHPPEPKPKRSLFQKKPAEPRSTEPKSAGYGDAVNARKILDLSRQIREKRVLEGVDEL